MAPNPRSWSRAAPPRQVADGARTRNRRTVILVAGGYGAVGRILCPELVAQGFDVIVAGRDLARAQAFAAPLGLRARRLDLDQAASWSQALDGADAVTVCVDQAQTAFAAHVLASRRRYYDITADDGFIRALERLPGPVGAAAVLSLGLAPGLTNLLATYCAAVAPTRAVVEIGLLSGLGDDHGPAAVAWTASAIFDPGRSRESVTVDFGSPWGIRRAPQVGFADQYALARAGFSATTGLCFDSRAATDVFFWLGRMFAGNAAVQWATTASSRWFRTRSAACVVSVRATDPLTGAVRMARLTGERETEMTARLTASMIAAVEAAPAPPGVRHIHDAVRPEDVLTMVALQSIGRLEINDGAGWTDFSSHSPGAIRRRP